MKKLLLILSLILLSFSAQAQIIGLRCENAQVEFEKDMLRWLKIDRRNKIVFVQRPLINLVLEAHKRTSFNDNAIIAKGLKIDRYSGFASIRTGRESKSRLYKCKKSNRVF